MNTFTRKSLAVALAGASVLSLAEPAEAVRVSANGTGQVLLYPYYTVRGSTAGKEFNTLVSVINATPSVKAVKVRFLEGKNSAGVLDFNLYLSPNDVWVGAIVPTAVGAKLVTGDRSCAVPALPAAGADFINYAYANDPAGGSIDRVREGWFEILEMGIVGNTAVANAATHNSAGVPANCALVATDSGAGMLAPNGGLFGSETLLNVQLGTDYTADPVALDNWRNAPLWTAPGSPTPDLADALPQRSTVVTTIAGEEQVIVTGELTWGGTNNADPVSAVLMHDTILNEFVLDTVTQSGTDWIITFPTKRFYYVPIDNTTQQVTALFQRNFVSSGACDDISPIEGSLYDREERPQPLIIFGEPFQNLQSLCWAANTSTFNNGRPLGSHNAGNIGTFFQNGWLRLGFPSNFVAASTVVASNHLLSSGVNIVTFNPRTGVTTTAPSATYFGLPAIGFAVVSYTNGFVPSGCAPGTCLLSNYGGNWVHKYTDNIKTP